MGHAPEMPERLDRLDLALVLAIGSLTLAFYLWFLTREPLVYGIDGPYYLIQVRAIERTGGLKYGDPPLAFYVFYALSFLLGGNRTLGVKLGTALSAALLMPSAYCLLRLEFRRREAPAIGALAMAFSPHLLRLSCDFLKNLMGTTFFTASLCLLALSARKGSAKLALASSAFLLLSGLTHSLAFAVALGLTVLYGTVKALVEREKRAELAKLLVLVLLPPAALALAGLSLFPRFFSDLLKGEAFLEELFSSEVSPLLLPPHMLNVAFSLGLLCFGLSWSGLLLGARGCLSKRPWGPLVLATALTGLVLTFPAIPPKWAWRFALMGFIPVATAVAALVHQVGSEKAISMALALALLTPLLAQTAVGATAWGPSISPAEHADLVAMSNLIPPRSVVICREMPLKYWAEYVLDCDVVKKPSPELLRRYEHVFLLMRADRELPPGPWRLAYRGEELLLLERLPLKAAA